MKILLYDWEAYNQVGLQRGLEKMGNEVILFSKKINNHLLDEEFLRELVLKIVQENIDFVISFNFFPMVSMACEAAKRVYASWIYSCPHYPVETQQAHYAGNFFFVFDRGMASSMKQGGLENVFHLPLAVDPLVFSKTCKRQIPKAEISFVGSLYTGELDYFEQIQGLPDYIKGYVDGICQAQMRIYGEDLVQKMCTYQLAKQIRPYVAYEMSPGMDLPFESFLTSIVQKRITVMERKRLIEKLAENIDFTLYTGSKTDEISRKISVQPKVDYYTEMPQVFRNSKLNLNITLRSITTGIPLRALDILACGGALFSNYQQELFEYFEQHKEVILWSGEEEMLELADYYLKHEEECKDIAQAGHEKALKAFSYENQLCRMFEYILGGQ